MDKKRRIVAKRIGVIGAGPAGLAVARVLLAENRTNPSCFSVTVLERSNDIGGVWNYTPDPVCHYNVPQETAQAVLTSYDERSGATGGFPTPIYDDLHTNLPTDVMQYPGFPFNAAEFPDHKQVCDYVHRYCDHHNLRRVVQLNMQVERIRYKSNAEWVCQVRRLDYEGTIEDLVFDAMVVCTGRTTHPYIPQVPGLNALALRKGPRCVLHAKEYRRASDFVGKTVLVVGGASSGSDISRQLSYMAAKVYVSVSHAKEGELEPKLGMGCKVEIERRPRIQSIGDSVVFADGSQIPIPDHIIYATGYLSAYPFIRTEDLSDKKKIAPFTDGHGVNDLYKRLLYIHNPTLAILGVPVKVVPFPLFEYQAMFLAKVFQGAVNLPRFEQMQKEWDEFAKNGSSVMGMAQVEYQNELVDLVKHCNPHLPYVPSEWVDRRKRTFELRLKNLGY
ncbi:hypothetical protein GGI25_002517 [Coemansia spiralis]|uniref:Flavin-containing monooxygenase n=2 Tax=Coemansia TaxID=4863 RepID=A0A9W8KYX6_9FUNG|nr:hypothetical protein BX070DRAFT_255525 [Coemansia spiralis]KAJ1993039.1 hypothetical protein EDC05_002480 [Coemansia umbellata]KAJ2622919.1 hypothetical protein GGI26_002885 [Coemansia sp. RSA 1358]KAJ2678166.1 hypothetical protein GGI25_002517 [Coemansia spiralis]